MPTTAVLCPTGYPKVLDPVLGEGQAKLGPQNAKASAFQLWLPKADDWLNSNMRLHRMVKAYRVRAWREAAAKAVEGWDPFVGPVRIEAHIYKPRRGRYDPNNLNLTTKSCVDGFVDAGILADDDWNHVIGPDHRHGGIGEPGIHFIFTPTQKDPA